VGLRKGAPGRYQTTQKSSWLTFATGEYETTKDPEVQGSADLESWASWLAKGTRRLEVGRWTYMVSGWGGADGVGQASSSIGD
jgi:hypothetical protein